MIENKWDTKTYSNITCPKKRCYGKHWKRCSLLQFHVITKKFAQCKALPTLKIDVFEIPRNKSIEKLFSKYELLILDQANSRTYPPEILILYFPITEKFLLHNPHHVLHRFPYFPIGPFSFDHTLLQVLDILNHQAKASYIQIIWVKHPYYG